MNEIVFQNRNKSYGAYKIRKTYPANVLIGFTITTFLASLPYFFTNKSVHKKLEKVKQITFEPIADLPLLPAAAPAKRKPPKNSKTENISPQPTPAKSVDSQALPQPDTQTNDAGEGNGEESAINNTPEGIEGSAGSEGKKTGTERIFAQIYYIKMPSHREQVELMFNEEIENDIKQGVKTSVVKFLGYNISHIHTLAVTDGHVHISHRQSFVMVNDSAAINMAQIESINEHEALLKNGEVIRIAKKFRKHVKERLAAYTNIAGDSAAVVAQYETKTRFSYKPLNCHP